MTPWCCSLVCGALSAFTASLFLVACVRRMHLDGKLLAAIFEAPALVLQHYQLFSQANMTGFPAL